MAAVVMFALAAGKARTGRALGNPVLRTEGRVTLIDGILATAVLVGLVLNAAAGWWWADPAARVRAGLSRRAGSTGDLPYRALIARRPGKPPRSAGLLDTPWGVKVSRNTP